MDASFIQSPNAAATSVRVAHSFITRDEQLGSAPRRQPLHCSQALFPVSCLLARIKTASSNQLALWREGKEREERTSRSFFMGRMQKFQPQEAKRALYFLPPPFAPTGSLTPPSAHSLTRGGHGHWMMERGTLGIILPRGLM